MIVMRVMRVMVVIMIAMRVIMINSKVYIMEYFMLVFFYMFHRNCVGLLVDCDFIYHVLNDKWNLLVNRVLFDLVDCEFHRVGHFVRNLNLSSVWNLMLSYIWLLDLDLEGNLVVDCYWELLFDVESFLLILCDWNLL